MTGTPEAALPRAGRATRPVPLVLASASPARFATLRAAGVDASVVVSAVDEDAAVADAGRRYGALGCAELALLLARAKCEDVAARLEGADPPAALDLESLVLGCDSVLEFDGQVHGKPQDPATARSRWCAMRGNAGTLHTGHWLIDLRSEVAGGTGATVGAVAATTVWFADIPDTEIDAYVATGEPLLVAGAFTMDGFGGPFVDRIEGDPHNVVGVSLPVVRELLAGLGLAWYDIRRRL